MGTWSIGRRLARLARALERGLIRRRELDARLSEEQRFHLEMLAARYERDGLEPGEARRRAAITFGGRSRFSEETRQEYGGRIVERLLYDARMTMRALRRSPVFSAAVVLTIALGVGATTVIFSVTDHVVLRPLAYAESGRLVVLREIIEELRDAFPSASANASHYLEWRRSCSVCEDMGALRATQLTMTGRGDPARLAAVRVSAGLLPMLGAPVELGRTFTAEEDHQGRDAVVVVSDAFWRRQFGGDLRILGSAITLDGVSRRVVGVLGPRFRLPKGHELGTNGTLAARTDIFVPLALTQREQHTPGEYDYAVIARLAPGVSVARAESELDALERELARRSPDKITLRSLVVPLHTIVLGRSARALVVLLAAVGVMLLIICVNLANLLLARNAARAREASIRVALGGDRARLVRGAITESLMLSLAGGVLAIALSRWGLRLLLSFAPPDLPRLSEITIDARVLAVSLAISIVAGLAFGAIPAFRTSQADPADTLRAGSRNASPSRRAARIRASLIGAQAALSGLLLVATGLFLMSFARLTRVDPGFDATRARRILALDVVLPPQMNEHAARAQVYDAALAGLAAQSGVVDAALSTLLPLEGESQVDGLSRENDTRPFLDRPTGSIRYVSGRFFAAMGTAVVRGRVFAESDRGRNVVVVSERTANAMWPGEDAIGKRMTPGSNDPLCDVIGVVADTRSSGLDQVGSLAAYIPYWQHGPQQATLIVRTSGDAGAHVSAMRAEIHRVAPWMPISNERTMADVLARSLAARRFELVVLLLFALTALVTASVGIYGIVAHSLGERTTEIGVRLALGARPFHIHRLVLREGLMPVAVGLGVSAVIVSAAGRAVSILLYDVRPADPVTLACVGATLLAIAAVACVMPARRAVARGVASVIRAE